VGIAAGNNTLLIDASGADGRMLRRLATALPWRRPVDALAALVDAEGIPAETLTRSANFARALGMRVALHFVLPSSSKAAAWRVIDPNSQEGDTVCSQLAADTVRIWLTGGSREGLKEVALAQSRELPAALGRALAAAPLSIVDIASLSFSGAGLRAAAARTVGRTRPTTTRGVMRWAGVTGLAVGAVLTFLVVVDGLARGSALRATVHTASREAAVPWMAEGIDPVPSGARVHRISGLSIRLANLSDFSPLMPLAQFVPNHSAPEELGAMLLEGYVLRPLAASLDRQIRQLLAPSDDPRHWIENARLVGEWLAAWEGLADSPREVDIRRLFVAAFGGDQSAWAEGTDLALVDTGAMPPSPQQGGLDVDGLTELARSNFVATMQQWAETVYTNGPVARAARRATDRSAGWREQHAALVDLRIALQDPAQQWLTAAKDRPDYGFELRILGRAVALGLLGQANALAAKVEVSRIRIDARDAVEYFILPEIGPLMVRSSTGQAGSSGPSLSLSPEVQAWSAFLDRVANAGFADLPRERPVPLGGFVTVDSSAVAEVSRQLRVFDRLASDLPAGLPPAIAQDLIRELASELVIGVTVSVEQALRPANMAGTATEQAERSARVAPALDDLTEIESWLRQRQGEDEADRVLSVRARIADAVLVAGAEALTVEDPLGVYLDPAADGSALVRRFERGLARLRRMHEQLGAPFIESASYGEGWAVMEWHNIGEDIALHERGDAITALSGLEGMLRAYSEDPAAACTAPSAVAALGRNDYIARVLWRFRSEFDHACSMRQLIAARAVYLELVDYFNRHASSLWPYSGDPDAPEISASALSEFIERLHASREDLLQLDDPFAKNLASQADFWTRDSDGGAAVRFRIAWRVRPSEEWRAENVIAFDFKGADLDGDEIYTWRYGVPLSLKMRLAKDSAYRFVAATDPDQRDLVLTGGGNGALLRIFSDLSNGALMIDAPIVNEEGEKEQLQVTARVTHADNRPMTLPEFTERPLGVLALDRAAAGDG
jgi:hypothetical protein